MKDYYKILGIGSDATNTQVSKAYRKLAIKYHPDVNPDDPEAAEKFKEIAEANEVLSDTQKRDHYDRTGSVDGEVNFDIDPFSMFGDLFGDAFGYRQAPAKGADIFKEIRITLEEAFSGVSKTILTASHMACKVCSGSGVTSWKDCDMCGGKGRTESRRGPFAVSMTCVKCRGVGRLSVVRCDKCTGSGKVEDEVHKHKIDIPAGIENGVRLVVKGKGEWLNRGVPGDLICGFSIDPHPLYEREGANLYCVIPITFPQSILGHEVRLPIFPNGQANAKVPPATKSGTVLRLVGMGMPFAPLKRHTSSSRGDLLVRVQVEPPPKPTKEYSELVKKLSILDDKQSYTKIEEFQKLIELSIQTDEETVAVVIPLERYTKDGDEGPQNGDTVEVVRNRDGSFQDYRVIHRTN